MAASRGIFIVLEGLDRSGKSTQVDRLVGRLQQSGRQAMVQKFPDRTTAIGKMIDAYLQSKTELDDRAIHLLFSANRWEVARYIEQQLANGVDVIADRYAFSGIAFSAAKGLPFDFCLNPDRGLPLPDVTVFLTVPPEVASARAAYGTERYETVEIQTRVRKQFERVGEVVRTQHGGDRWADVTAAGTIEEVGARVWAAVEPVIGRPAPAVVARLWE